MTNDYYPMKPSNSKILKKTSSVSDTVESRIVLNDCKLKDKPKDLDNYFWAGLSIIILSLVYTMK